MDHLFFFGNHFRPAGHPSQVMPRIAVVSFNGRCMPLADDMAALWQYFGESFPLVGVKDAALQVLDFGV